MEEGVSVARKMGCRPRGRRGGGGAATAECRRDGGGIEHKCFSEDANSTQYGGEGVGIERKGNWRG
jgi:hypothetical protein